jgi:hypothetical protein
MRIATYRTCHTPCGPGPAWSTERQPPKAATAEEAGQESNTNQHTSLRSRWSPSTRSRISLGSCARRHWHSRRRTPGLGHDDLSAHSNHLATRQL